MRFKLHHIFFTLCLGVSSLVVTTANAQSSGMQDVEIMPTENDKLLFSPGGEGETRFKAPVTISGYGKDSVATIPNLTPARKSKPEQTSKPVEKPNTSKEDDDSILSFNFLYYIIQKYKLQDIVD